MEAWLGHSEATKQDDVIDVNVDLAFLKALSCRFPQDQGDCFWSGAYCGAK